MNEFLAQYHLAKPVYLWLLLALPILWMRLRGRSLSVILWRSLIVALLVLTLADPQSVSEQTKVGERIFAFDLSRSIPVSMRGWMDRVTQGSLSPTPADRVFVFGAEARQIDDKSRWLSGETSTDSVKPGRTSLKKLFATLLNLPAAPRTLFLFTDGWETEGKVEPLLASIALSGLKIFPFIPAERPSIPNVAVRKIVAPNQGNTGEAFNLKVIVENQSDRVVDGTLVLTRNDQPFKSEPVKVKAGSQIFSYQATIPEGPLTSFRATFTPRQPALDLIAPDNQAIAWVAGRTKDKILVLNGSRGAGRYLEEVLRRLGFDVTAWNGDPPPPSPAGYAVVIFNDVEREKFSASYLAAIERHVAQGNGFLMLGGEASFGPGGFRRTPIESVLPVEFKEPKREEKNRAVVLVIDKSGSMRENNKLLYAQEAAKTLAKQLKDRDLLGVVGFDVSPFVVVPLSPIASMRGTVMGQIDRLKAGGKTYLYPAIVEAKRQLERQSANKKHLIILSDGETGGSGGDYIDLVNVMQQELKITISTVAIGDQANIPLMKRIAQYGGGLFHHTYDPTTLPQIVLQQIQEKPTDEPLVEKDFTPVPGRGSELLAGFPVRRYPILKGYMETDLKRGASPDLIIPTQERRPPLLASWSYGRGKAVAFTSDLEGRWSRHWIPWDGLAKFWEKVIDWLRPPEESIPPHEVRVNLVSTQPVLDFYIYDDANGNGLMRYSFNGKGGRGEGVLKKLAPGHFQTTLPFSTPGDYQIELVEEGRGKRSNFPPVGYTLPFNPNSEIPLADFNISLLEQLARATGGEVNPRSAEALSRQEIVQSHKPLRQPLIIVACSLFFLEIAVRRFFFQ